MTNRTWITDNIIPALSPNDIEDTGISCTGWWKAGVSATAMIVEDHTSAKGAGGDDIWYVTEWKDSSGEDNHLLDTGLGKGPQIYGSDANYLGSASDEVSGTIDGVTTNYPVAHFTELTEGVNQGQKFLECDPDDKQHLGYDIYEGDDHCWNFMAVARYHNHGEDRVYKPICGNENSWSMTQKVCALGFLEDSGSPNHAIAHALVGSNEIHASGTTPSVFQADIGEDVYAVLGCFCTLSAWNGGNNMGRYKAWCNGTFGTSDEPGAPRGGTGNYHGSANEHHTFRVGMTELYSGAGGDYNLDGRIIEMACWKSEEPISEYKIWQVWQYWKEKFGNDI